MIFLVLASSLHCFEKFPGSRCEQQQTRSLPLVFVSTFHLATFLMCFFLKEGDFPII